MENFYGKNETGCCPRFIPKPWHKKEIKWNNKLFIKDRVKSFLHIPLTIKSVIIRNMTLIDEKKVMPKDFIMLAEENSLWGADFYFSVAKPIKGAKMAKISGTFLTKVYDGPYSKMGEWIKDMQEYVKSKKKTMKKLYFFYTVCPKCAKYYGHNHVVLLAKV